MSTRLLELHRHLEGSIRLSTILEIAETYEVESIPLELEALRRRIEVRGSLGSLSAFLERLELCRSVYLNLDVCHRVAKECVEDAAKENIGYMELRFSPSFMATPHGLDMEDVIDAVSTGVKSAERETSIRVGLIGILDRSHGPDPARAELAAILNRESAFVGIDLAGDEAKWPPSFFVDHFDRVRSTTRLGITVHAGEALGSESVRVAVEKLGAIRVGHAVRAIEDPRLIDTLVERGVGIEVCLTSNLHTGAVSSYDCHPVAKYLAAGLRVSLGTDDPTVSAINLRHELGTAAMLARLSTEQVARTQEDSLRMAFLSNSDREIVRAALTMETKADP